MNKKMNYLKMGLVIINLVMILYFISVVDLNGIKLPIYLLFLIILCYITFKDLRSNIVNSKKYNTLFFIIELIILFIIGRALFDPNICYITNHYNDAYNTYEGRTIQYLYLIQNFYYFIGLYMMLFMYHVIECKGLKYKESKFNKIIVACLLINFVLVIPTFECLNYSFSTTELIIFITAEIILISTEIYRLIKDNGKKYEWPIYISFFFNTFAVIFIIISIFMY